VLEILRGPVVVREYLLSAGVRYFDQMLVAVRPIQRGEPVAEGVGLERREVTTRLGRYMTDLSELEGMRAKTRIGAGRPIDMRNVEPIPAVERKDRVSIRVNVGTIRASIEGVATESGVIGDRIVVQNVSSREKLLAEIVAPGVVQVIF
jgi:flagella basal body P-ring formation protein FlgA